MDKKNLVMTIDNDNGIKKISLYNGKIIKTVSLSDEGCEYLDKIGADIILDYDEKGKLLNIELMGL